MTFIQFERTELTAEDLLQGNVQLATPPEIYARVRRLVDDPESTTAMIAEVIEHDPALAARLLQLANSAFFAQPHPVKNITDAVRIIGVRELQDLILATEVIQRFDAIPAELIDIYRFWRDSLRCAVLARALAQQCTPRGKLQSVFIAGLLHGIGHLVIYSRIPELGRKALQEHLHRQIPLHMAQREVLGFDYAQVGAALARHWDLPPMLCTVLAHHLAPDQCPAFVTETALVHLALLASQARSFEASEATAVMPQETAPWARAGLSPDALHAAMPEAEAEFEAALALLR